MSLNYFISILEPMHDLAHHIENILEEIKTTLPREEQEQLESILSAATNGKQQLR